jgi:hypothetical protein
MKATQLLHDLGQSCAFEPLHTERADTIQEVRRILRAYVAGTTEMPGMPPAHRH